jgi:hypothetical protein
VKPTSKLIDGLIHFTIEVSADELVDEFMHALLESLSEVSRCERIEPIEGAITACGNS